MKSNRPKKKAAPSQAATRGRPNKGRFEWPLLIFPAAILVTLVILYAVNRSIKNEIPVRPASGEAVSRRMPAASLTRQSDRTASDDNVRIAPDAVLDAERPGDERTTADRPPVATDDKDSRIPARDLPVRDGPNRRMGAEGLDGSEPIIVLLRQAVEEKDHTRIKQCLDELVALGDQAIAPLTQLISNEGGEAGIWAAEALARIGTPAATSTLLDTLAAIKEGQYKEELGKQVAGISNHESWPVLLENILNTGDSTVLRAAAASLSRMADAPVVDDLVARYDGATSERDIQRITQVISDIRSSKATEPLLSLAGDVASSPQDPLQKAAVDALGKIGDPQAISYLLRKLEAAPPGEDGYLVNTIAQINQPEAQAALLYAAAGNKEVSAEHGRTAAIYALRNFPDGRTLALLEQIVAQEQNAQVSAAATRTIEDIHRTSPHVVAKAESLVKTDSPLPERLQK